MTTTSEVLSTRAPSRDPGLVEAGGWPFLITAFLGRIPSSMLQLGYLMVLSTSGRGLAMGGLVVACIGLGTAIGAPVLGRLVDRFGALWVLTAATALSVLGQIDFLRNLSAGSSSTELLVCAGLVGAANPQIGPVARSHWSHLVEKLGAPRLMSKALGYEGAVDELGFVIGPVLAGSLVSFFGAQPAAIAMLVLTVVLQGLFLGHLWHVRAPRTVDVRDDGSREAMGLGWSVLPPMLACLGVGLLFGATQTALTALFNAREMPQATGLVYGCVGVGSGLASLAVGRLSPRIPVWTRVLGGAVVILVGALLMMTLPGALLASVHGLLLGCGAGVTLVSSFGWMERIAPRTRIATMMTTLATCLTLGVSTGAAVAGKLAAQPSHAFWPLLVAAALAVLGSAGMRLSSRRES